MRAVWRFGKSGLLSLGLAASLGAPDAAAQDVPIGAFVIAGEIDEFWRDVGVFPTSGQNIRAVRPVDAVRDEEALVRAIVPVGLEGEVFCLDVRSNEGSYTGFQELEAAEGWAGGVSDVPFQTKYIGPPKSLLEVGAGGTLTRLTRGACDGPDEEFIVSGWQIAPDPGLASGLEVLVLGPSDTELTWHLDGATDRCKPTDTMPMVYSHVCTIPADLLGVDRLALEIRRFELVPNSEGDLVWQELQPYDATIILR